VEHLALSGATRETQCSAGFFSNSNVPNLPVNVNLRALNPFHDHYVEWLPPMSKVYVAQAVLVL
jgi:hypothetical protein